MAETLEGFAQRLRELRKSKNLSQTELGQLAGLHYTHIGRFERGASRPSGDTLMRLADALGAPTTAWVMALLGLTVMAVSWPWWRATWAMQLPAPPPHLPQPPA